MPFMRRPQSLHFTQAEVQDLEFLTKYRVKMCDEKDNFSIRKQSAILQPFSASMRSLNGNFRKSATKTAENGEKGFFKGATRKRRSIAVIGRFLKKGLLGRAVFGAKKEKNTKKGFGKKHCSVSSMEFWEEDYETIKRRSSVIKNVAFL